MLLAFVIDIALYAFTKHEMRGLGVPESTLTGPGAPSSAPLLASADALAVLGFWLTFVAFILLCVAGCTVCFGRRRDRMAGATSYSMSTSKGSWRDRFRR